jgi:beta-N-acetylglucosaminidase
MKSDSAKPFVFDIETKSVALVNDKLVYTDWQPPQNKSALELVNAAVNSIEMRTALEDNAAELALSLKDYQKLNSFGKNQVSQAVLDNRPAGGYGSKDSIKTVFNNAVSTALSKQQAAVEAVNKAGTAAAMQTALSSHAQLLELDWNRFTKLTPDQQSTMLEIMLNGKPYDSADKVTTAYISALQSVELTHIITYVDYDHNLSYYVDKQMSKNPQTDLYGGGWKTADRNLVEWFINAANFVNEMRPAAIIKSGPARMRTGPGTEHDVVCLLDEGSGPYFRINEAVDSAGYTWYRLLTGSRVGWVRGDLLTLTEKKGEGIFQFLLLSETTHVDPSEVNEKILKGKGILEGKAEAFITGAETYNINEIFLISLALHETGNGKSTLATGVNFKGKTVYNMYGIGAIDADPINKGAEYAYNQGWFTPEAAIIGGAKFVGESYIHHSTYRQNTLYKMRWNPDRPGQHQYATDIGWAAKQVSGIKKLYDLMTSYVLHFEIPRFK